MSFFNALIGMGATVMMPIIFFVVGLIFGVKPGKAFKAGMTVGIGFTGINMVVGLLLTSLGPAAMDMATRSHRLVFTPHPLHRGGRDSAEPHPAAA